MRNKRSEIIALQKEFIELRFGIEKALGVLDSILCEGEKLKISNGDVVGIVCSVVGINANDFLSDSRMSKFVTARRIYSHICVDYLQLGIGESMSFIRKERSTYYNNKEKHDAFYGLEDEYTLLYDKAFQKIKEIENEKA